MSNREQVLAIFVNWNGKGVLRKAVDSLLSSDYSDLDLLVVDNGSTDDSISSLPENVEVVRLETNLGYGGAINAVIRPFLKANSASYFLLLNNDVVLSKETVSTLMEHAHDKGPGVFGPRILQFSDPSKLEAAWGKVSWSHVLAKYYGKKAQKNGARWGRTRRVELLLGSVLLIHRQVFDKVGLFDENFFMYHEEVDFLYRTKKERFPAYYCPSAEVIHRGAHSTQRRPLKKTYWIRRNTVYFLRKHEAGTLQWSYFGATLFLSLIYNTILLRWSRVNTIWRAVREGLAC